MQVVVRTEAVWVPIEKMLSDVAPKTKLTIDASANADVEMYPQMGDSFDYCAEFGIDVAQQFTVLCQTVVGSGMFVIRRNDTIDTIRGKIYLPLTKEETLQAIKDVQLAEGG